MRALAALASLVLVTAAVSAEDWKVTAIALPGAPAEGVRLDYLAVDHVRNHVWDPRYRPLMARNAVVTAAGVASVADGPEGKILVVHPRDSRGRPGRVGLRGRAVPPGSTGFP